MLSRVPHELRQNLEKWLRVVVSDLWFYIIGLTLFVLRYIKVNQSICSFFQLVTYEKSNIGSNLYVMILQSRSRLYLLVIKRTTQTNKIRQTKRKPYSNCQTKFEGTNTKFQLKVLNSSSKGTNNYNANDTKFT